MDRTFADGYNDQIEQILLTKCVADILEFAPSSHGDDCKNATDYIITFKNIPTIACRLRKDINFFLKYHDITIRRSRPSGAKTEFEKSKSGGPTYYFYGWTDPNNSNIPYWVLIDMNKFKNDKIRPNDEKLNKDGTTFYTYDVSKLCNLGCIVNMSHLTYEYLVKEKLISGKSGQW